MTNSTFAAAVAAVAAATEDNLYRLLFWICSRNITYIFCLCNDSTLAAGNFDYTRVRCRIIFTLIKIGVVFISPGTPILPALQFGRAAFLSRVFKTQCVGRNCDLVQEIKNIEVEHEFGLTNVCDRKLNHLKLEKVKLYGTSLRRSFMVSSHEQTCFVDQTVHEQEYRFPVFVTTE